MAENKINEEILNDDELDSVAGGTSAESKDDFKKMESFGLITSSQRNDKDYGALKAAFGRFGITVDTHGGLKSNKYKLNGNSISRDDAWTYIIGHLK